MYQLDLGKMTGAGARIRYGRCRHKAENRFLMDKHDTVGPGLCGDVRQRHHLPGAVPLFPGLYRYRKSAGGENRRYSAEESRMAACFRNALVVGAKQRKCRLSMAMTNMISAVLPWRSPIRKYHRRKQSCGRRYFSSDFLQLKYLKIKKYFNKKIIIKKNKLVV